jgi:hypothetical protein
MATGGEVMTMLCDGVEYVIYGDDYDSINWFDKPAAITKAQFEAGFAQYDKWKAKQDSKVKADKAALLNKLGITAEEAALLLS